MIDISESGAAIYTDEAFYTNEQFVELHTEGYETMCGRVAREFSGGFASECGAEVERQRAREELEIFKETLGKRQEFKTLAAFSLFPVPLSPHRRWRGMKSVQDFRCRRD